MYNNYKQKQNVKIAYVQRREKKCSELLGTGIFCILKFTRASAPVFLASSTAISASSCLVMSSWVYIFMLKSDCITSEIKQR